MDIKIYTYRHHKSKTPSPNIHHLSPTNEQAPAIRVTGACYEKEMATCSPHCIAVATLLYMGEPKQMIVMWLSNLLPGTPSTQAAYLNFVL